MAARIETMAYFGKMPWHGLGTRLEEADTYDIETTCRKAGLDWDVELAPLVTADNHTPVERNAVRRTSDKRILGTVGTRFTLVQNRDAFKWFQPFLEAKEASLHTAGALCEGSRVWVLAKLNRDPLVITPGDEVEKFILLSHGHDGSLAVRAGFTPIRVVCQNTLRAAHADKASQLIRLKHTADVHKNLENVREIMNAANAAFEATAEQYRRLVRKSVNQSDLRKYVRKVLGAKDDKPSTRMENMVNKVLSMCDHGRGNNLPGVRGTYWAAYNGVSEWLTHERGHNPDSRMNSLWFGDSANINQRALEIALQMAV